MFLRLVGRTVRVESQIRRWMAEAITMQSHLGLHMHDTTYYCLELGLQCQLMVVFLDDVLQGKHGENPFSAVVCHSGNSC